MSDIDPTDISHGTTPHISENFSHESAEPIPPNRNVEREGLPSSYRMRADAHYVEHLSTRRGDRAPSDHIRVAPDPPERPDGRERAERLLAQLTEDMATLESAASALTGETSRIARRVNVDLIKAQVWRAGWALRANAILDNSNRLQVRPRPLGFLLGHVRNGWAAECRLEDITLDVVASDWNAVVPVDEQALLAGLTGAIVATLGLVGQVEGATIAINATCASGELRSIEVVQDEVLVSPSVSARFFDASSSDRPGGWFAALGASVARVVAQRHGGDAVFLADERRGSTLRLNFSRA